MADMHLAQQQGLDLINILTNPDLLKKNLEKFKEAEERARVVLDLVAPASTLIQIKNQISLKEEELLKLKDNAKAVIESAHTKADSTTKVAEVKLQKANEAERDSKQQAHKVVEDQRVLHVERQALEKAKLALNNKKIEAEEVKQEFIEKRDKLIIARQHIVSALDNL